MIEELTDNAKIVLEKRYLQRNENGEIIENAEGMFIRVANTLASVDLEEDVEKLAHDFYRIMSELKYLPNSPTLMSAGTGVGTLSACFVLPLTDSMEGITKAGHDAAMVQKYGGGTGFALSELRPKGSPISTTHGKACGPIAVLRYLSAISTMVTQGGKRDGANMAVMNVHHPDIEEFIDCKQVEGDIHNFNISVGVTDEFMQGVLKEQNYVRCFPVDPERKDSEKFDDLPASHIFNKIVENAWSNGEPGMVFLDTINRNSPVRHVGEITATNPCGEQPLLPNESCNLGSINLSKFVNGKGKFDWLDLQETVRIAVNMLDNVIDANTYVVDAIKERTLYTRKIGLGVMGFADMLVKMGLSYDSDEALSMAHLIMDTIKLEADKASNMLAHKKGQCPALVNTGDFKRNSCRLTVAPTGTISMIAGCSSGIEPLFSLVYRKHNILEGETLYYVNEDFKRIAIDKGFYSEDLMEYLADGGSLQTRDDVPYAAKKLFMVSEDIAPYHHVNMQSVFQQYVDSGVSKTINLPNNATVNDVRDAYVQAWETGCKGITVYRAGSRDKEVLTSGHVDNGDIIYDVVSKRERPGVLSGQTSRIRTGRGNVYVTVNVDDSGKPFEVFATHGKAGGNDSAMAEAVSRLVSLSLRSGVPVNDIIIQLRGITDTPAWDNGVLVRSVPDALAMVLANSNSVEDVLSVDDLCPECSSDAVAFEEGCFKCYECGYSRC